MGYHNKGFFVFCAGILLIAGCSSLKKANNVVLQQSHANAKYDIHFRTPDGWIVAEQSDLRVGEFVIQAFKKESKAGQALPLGVHNPMEYTYVSFWPHGYGTELPYGQAISFEEAENLPEFQFPVNREESVLLLLNDGSVWAYFIVPKKPHNNWERYGFIYAQIRTTNTSTTCFDDKTGKKLSMKECDFLAGDRFIRKGDINEEDAIAVRQILESIRLREVKKPEQANALIKVEKPQPHTTITSPLTVAGKAKGRWYFEGVFEVELYDAKNNLLAQTTVQAQENWMVEVFVPFKATLKFKAPADQRGKLVFVKANPSGLKKHRMTYAIPVTFSEK